MRDLLFRKFFIYQVLRRETISDVREIVSWDVLLSYHVSCYSNTKTNVNCHDIQPRWTYLRLNWSDHMERCAHLSLYIPFFLLLTTVTSYTSKYNNLLTVRYSYNCMNTVIQTSACHYKSLVNIYICKCVSTN